MSERPISRRDVLKAISFGSVALALGACASAVRSPESSPSSSPSPSASSSPSSPPATASASPSHTASPTSGPSLRERIAGLIIVGFRGATLADAGWVRRAIRDGNLGGVILFDRDQQTGGARNVVSPRQVAALTADLRAAAGGRGLIVSIDQEGGIVTRLAPARGFPAVASEADIGAANSVKAASTWGKGIATTLAAAGINLRHVRAVVGQDGQERY